MQSCQPPDSTSLQFTTSTPVKPISGDISSDSAHLLYSSRSLVNSQLDGTGNDNSAGK